MFGSSAYVPYARAIRIIASRLRSTSSSVVAHDDTLMRIAVFPMPFRNSAPARPILLDATYDFARNLRRAEQDQHLIDHHFVQYLKSSRPQAALESLRERTRALNQFAQS